MIVSYPCGYPPLPSIDVTRNNNNQQYTPIPATRPRKSMLTYITPRASSQWPIPGRAVTISDDTPASHLLGINLTRPVKINTAVRDSQVRGMTSASRRLVSSSKCFSSSCVVHKMAISKLRSQLRRRLPQSNNTLFKSQHTIHPST